MFLFNVFIQLAYHLHSGIYALTQTKIHKVYRCAWKTSLYTIIETTLDSVSSASQCTLFQHSSIWGGSGGRGVKTEEVVSGNNQFVNL